MEDRAGETGEVARAAAPQIFPKVDLLPSEKQRVVRKI